MDNAFVLLPVEPLRQLLDEAKHRELTQLESWLSLLLLVRGGNGEPVKVTAGAMRLMMPSAGERPFTELEAFIDLCGMVQGVDVVEGGGPGG